MAEEIISLDEYLANLGDEFEIVIEYNSEELAEGARPPRMNKKQRAGNTVKAQTMKEITGDDSPVKGAIKKIFMHFDKMLKRNARELKTPITGINVDKITIRRKP